MLLYMKAHLLREIDADDSIGFKIPARPNLRETCSNICTPKLFILAVTVVGNNGEEGDEI